MDKQEVIIRFEDISYKYSDHAVILDDANFTVRKNSKITIIGQNGAGKSTIFKLLTGELKPKYGEIHVQKDLKIAISEQMISEDKLDCTILEYFKTAFPEVKYGIEKDISKIFYIVNLQVPLDRIVRDLSGGQKARLLLAYALIQEPDILLLDEPTNNLDEEGIAHLTTFLVMYEKTCIVISHDTDFLNTFTDGVLNLDIYTHKVEQFVGNYYDVLNQIDSQIERERLKNARIEKSVKIRFEKVNKLGGKSVAMRRLARKVRDQIEVDREEMVDLRKEDKAIPSFEITAQHCPGEVININSISAIKNYEIVSKPVEISMHRGHTLYISGPNGIGKSTTLRSFLDGKGCVISPNVRVGYYSQDFSELDFDQSAFDSLKEVMLGEKIHEKIYATAARFLIPGNLLNNKIGSLSEGQKGLLCYARFMLQEPGLLIMDEPTNHINFRHLPIIAEAIQNYKGALILVSHLPDFMSKIHVDFELDLKKIIEKK